MLPSAEINPTVNILPPVILPPALIIPTVPLLPVAFTLAPDMSPLPMLTPDSEALIVCDPRSIVFAARYKVFQRCVGLPKL